jgi:CRP-like cAMP-binding protein
MFLRKIGGNAEASSIPSSTLVPWYWKKLDLFDDVGETARREFFKHTERHDYHKGQHIFMSQDPATKIFYLDQGLVKIYDLTEDGTASIYWFGVPGDVFGMGALCGSATQMVFAQSVEPVRLFAIERTMFERILQNYPKLALNVIRLMGARLRLACDSVTDLSSRRTDRRLARLLLRVAENCGRLAGSSIELGSHITHQEFANMIGACRQTITGILQSFRDLGFIDMTGRAITILAIDDLRKFANGSDNSHAVDRRMWLEKRPNRENLQRSSLEHTPDRAGHHS